MAVTSILESHTLDLFARLHAIPKEDYALLGLIGCGLVSCEFVLIFDGRDEICLTPHLLAGLAVDQRLILAPVGKRVSRSDKLTLG